MHHLLYQAVFIWCLPTVRYFSVGLLICCLLPCVCISCTMKLCLSVCHFVCLFVWIFFLTLQFFVKLCEVLVISLQSVETVCWATGRTSRLKKFGVGLLVGNLTGALHVQLSPPLPLSLVPVKPANPGSGKWPLKWRELFVKLWLSEFSALMLQCCLRWNWCNSNHLNYTTDHIYTVCYCAVQGGSLGALIKRAREYDEILNEFEVADWLIHIALALQHLHSK